MTFYNKVIKNIDELIKTKLALKNIYSQIDKIKYKKDINQITFKTSNYNKWLGLLKKKEDVLTKVKNTNDIKSLKLSESLTKKLMEIFKKDNLEDIQLAINEIKKLKKEHNLNDTESSNDEDIKIKNEIDNLLLIHDIGNKTAEKLVKTHNVTLDKLKIELAEMIKEDKDNEILLVEKVINKPELYKSTKQNINLGTKVGKQAVEARFGHTKYLKHLHYSQLIGLKHVDNINKRIPRQEIIEMEKIIKLIASKINKDIIVNICGSYRRGNTNSGDIDLLITHKKCLTQDEVKNVDPSPLNILIYNLTKIGFLVDHLTLDGDTKYMGLCKLKGKNNIPRRIDIRFIAYQSYGAALLYFTGSGEFNKQMRLHALKRGYSINEYCLTKMNKRKKTDEHKYFSNEKDIFTFLEYPFKLPTDRNV